MFCACACVALECIVLFVCRHSPPCDPVAWELKQRSPCSASLQVQNEEASNLPPKPARYLDWLSLWGHIRKRFTGLHS